jgi:hypothetical protein
MNNIINFPSSTVRAYTEDEVSVVGFGDHDESPENYIIVSRYDEPGAEDMPRDAMIGIQTSESAYEVAAAISAITLSRHSIEIVVNDKNIQDVGAKILRTTFEINDEEFEHLTKYIELINAGSSINFIKKLP